MPLDRAAILARRPAPVLLEVPGLDDSVYIRGMTGREVEGYLEAIKADPTNGGYVLRLTVAAHLCDQAGKLLFQLAESAQSGDALTFRVMKVISDAALELSGLGEEKVEDVAKNSSATPAAASSSGGSDSPGVA